MHCGELVSVVARAMNGRPLFENEEDCELLNELLEQRQEFESFSAFADWFWELPVDEMAEMMGKAGADAEDEMLWLEAERAFQFVELWEQWRDFMVVQLVCLRLPFKALPKNVRVYSFRATCRVGKSLHDEFDFSKAIRCVLAQLYPSFDISDDSLAFCNAVVKDCMLKLAAEASRHVYEGWLESAQLQEAVQLAVGGALGLHAVSEGRRALRGTRERGEIL